MSFAFSLAFLSPAIHLQVGDIPLKVHFPRYLRQAGRLRSTILTPVAARTLLFATPYDAYFTLANGPTDQDRPQLCSTSTACNISAATAQPRYILGSTLAAEYDTHNVESRALRTYEASNICFSPVLGEPLASWLKCVIPKPRCRPETSKLEDKHSCPPLVLLFSPRCSRAGRGTSASGAQIPRLTAPLVRRYDMQGEVIGFNTSSFP